MRWRRINVPFKNKNDKNQVNILFNSNHNSFLTFQSKKKMTNLVESHCFQLLAQSPGYCHPPNKSKFCIYQEKDNIWEVNEISKITQFKSYQDFNHAIHHAKKYKLAMMVHDKFKALQKVTLHFLCFATKTKIRLLDVFIYSHW